MAELRAGGLALVTRGQYSGCVVVTEELILPGALFKGPNGLAYTSAGDVAAWLCIGSVKAQPVDATQAAGKLDGFALFRERSLMPIGDEDFSHEKDSEKQLQNA